MGRLWIPWSYLLPRVLHLPHFLLGDLLEGRRGLGEHCPGNAEQLEPLRLKDASWPQKGECFLRGNVLGLEMHFCSVSTSFVFTVNILFLSPAGLSVFFP